MRAESSSSCGYAPTNGIFLTSLLRSWNQRQLGACRPGGAGSGLFREYAAREFNVVLWVSLIAITGLLLERVLQLFRLWAKARKIPGPPCTSFFGHGAGGGFSSRENFMEFVSQSHNKYGSVCKLWLGPSQLMVSIKDPALVREVLSKASEKLPFIGKAFRMAFGRSSLFFCPYEQAKQRRESLALELNKKLLGRADMISKSVVDYMMDWLEMSKSSGIVDCRAFSQHVAFSYLGTLLFGDAFVTWSKATSYEELLMEISKEASFWASHTVRPFWKKEFWRFQSLCAELTSLTEDIIRQCRENCNTLCASDQMCYGKTASFSKKDGMFCPGGFLQDQLSLLEIDSHHYSSEELCGNIMGLMFHGCLSTSSLISAVLESLARNPDIQDKVYTEITVARQVSAKEKHGVGNMPLLLATIYESARLVATGLVLQSCSLKNDLGLKNGVTIPAGAVLMVPVQLLHMEKSNWGSDAEKFNPYRFLSKSRKASNLTQETSLPEATEEVDANEGPVILNDPTDNSAFLAFGSGVRACVCQKPVVQGIATMFASLLESYEVRIQSGDIKSTTQDILFARRSSS